MSFRRLWVLIKHLPQESWTQTALRDADGDLEELQAPETEPQFGPWSQSDLLVARLIDEVAHLRFITARGAGFQEYPEPEPTPRPGLRRASQRPPEGLSEEAFLYLNAKRAPAVLTIAGG